LGAQRTLKTPASLLASPPRRRALEGLGAVAASFIVAGCERIPERDAVLRATVVRVVEPAARRVLDETRALDAALRPLAERAEPGPLEPARGALARTLVAWRRASAFRAGPFVDSHAFVQAMFWPVRGKDVDALLERAGTLDAASLERAGANQKGLYALEYLLFGRSERPFGAAEAHLVRALAANVLEHAERGVRGFSGSANYAERFAGAGQDGVAQLLALTTDAVEIVFAKLDRVRRGHAAGSVEPTAVEGYWSHGSLELALALLAGAETLYAGAKGGGLAPLVAVAGPAIADHAQALFTRARGKLGALGGPLERVVTTASIALSDAADELLSLERTLKVEVAGALGLQPNLAV
jgi:predicted lipoprotein